MYDFFFTLTPKFFGMILIVCRIAEGENILSKIIVCVAFGFYDCNVVVFFVFVGGFFFHLFRYYVYISVFLANHHARVQCVVCCPSVLRIKKMESRKPPSCQVNFVSNDNGMSTVI